MVTKYACPCCGYLTLDARPPGTWDICAVCWWEDDLVQYSDADFRGGANDVSLNEARAVFKRVGASDERFLSKVRGPFPSEYPIGGTEHLETRGRQLLFAFSRAQKNWRALRTLGITIDFADGLRMSVPAQTPVIRPTATDLALGLVTLSNSPDLRQWAAVLLGLANIELEDLGQHSDGPALLEALWDASVGTQIEPSTLYAAEALAKGPRLH